MRTAAVALAAALLAVPALSAPDEPDLAQLRLAGFEREARLQDDAAWDAWRQALEAASAQAARLGGASQSAAMAELFLHRFWDATEETARYRDAERVLAAALKRKNLPPVLAGWTRWRRAGALARCGDFAEARAESARLGFIDAWKIVGPFDNLEGRGFAVEYPPEQEPGIDGTYEGKERKVAWRELPARPFLGFIDLAGLLRPNRQALAYAVAFVRSDRDRDVAVRAASDDGIRIWVNGERIVSHNGNRPCRFDQDVAAARLGKGWNRILLKVSQAEEGWGFRLRLTELDGSAAEGLAVWNPAKGIPNPPAAAQTTTAAPDRGGADFYARLLSETDPDVEARLDAALLLSAQRSFTDAEPAPDRELLLRAREAGGAPSARVLYALACATRSETAVSDERNEHLRRKTLDELLKLDPAHGAALCDLADYFLDHLQSPQNALSCARRALAASPGAPRALLAELRALNALRWNDEALRAALDLTPKPGRDRDLWIARARAQLAQGRGAESLADFRAAVEADAVASDASEQIAELLLKQGKPDRALAAVAPLAEYAPLSDRPAWSRISLLRQSGDWKKTLAQTELALKIAPQEASLWEEKGKLLHRLGQDAQAQAAWREALRLAPQSVTLTRYLELLDRGRESLEERVAEPTEPALREAKTLPLGDDPYLPLVQKRFVSLNRDGTSTEVWHLLIRVQSEYGARRLASYPIPYVPDEQVLKVARARVHRPDGSVQEGQLPKRAGDPVAFPPLARGDVVEMLFRIDDLKQSFFGDYFGTTYYFQSAQPFADAVPVRRSVFELACPPDRKVFLNRKNGAPEPERKDGEDGTLYRWEMKEIPRWTLEPLMPSLTELSPAAQVSTFEDWKALGTWYWNLIKDQGKADAAIRAKVKELTAGTPDPQRKIEAIYNFVTGQVRYIAWEFGIHGFKPYTVSQIYANQFGDCKDKALLICAMLKEAGIQAYPVLLYANTRTDGGGRPREDLALPLIDHFNHCIAYVPPQPGWLEGETAGVFLDGTAAAFPWNVLPEGDADAEVFVVTGDGGFRARTPSLSAESNRTRTETDIRLFGNLSGSAQVRLTAEGNRAAETRSFLSSGDRPAESLERLYGGRLPGARLKNLALPNLGRRDLPVVLTFQLQVPQMATANARGKWLQPFPDFFLPERFSELAGLSRRTTDVVFSSPWECDTVLRYRLPARWRPNALPPTAERRYPFGMFEVRYDWNGRVLTIRQTVRLDRQRIPRERYDDFRAFCNDAERALGRPVWLVVEESEEEAPLSPQVLKLGDADVKVRERAAEELLAQDEEAIPPLKQGLGHADPQIAESCRALLAKLESFPRRLRRWGKTGVRPELSGERWYQIVDDDAPVGTLRLAVSQGKAADGPPCYRVEGERRTGAGVARFEADLDAGLSLLQSTHSGNGFPVPLKIERKGKAWIRTGGEPDAQPVPYDPDVLCFPYVAFLAPLLDAPPEQRVEILDAPGPFQRQEAILRRKEGEKVGTPSGALAATLLEWQAGDPVTAAVWRDEDGDIVKLHVGKDTLYPCSAEEAERINKKLEKK